MTSFKYAEQAPPPTQLTARAVLATWRHITRAQISAAFLFGSAVFLFHVISWSRGMLNKPSLILPLIATFVQDQLGAFALMLAVVVADRVTGKDVHRRTAYAVAVVVSAAVMAPLGSIAGTWFVEPAFSWSKVLQGTNYMFFEWVVLAGAATFIYTDRRRARAAQARMRAAEIGRAHAAKRTLESRLQAMQARVEPQFLFNTLAQVKTLYQLDAASGECMFAELIAYLRAAMPKMRDTSSTLAQEIELARAYLAIVKVRLGDRLTYEIESPPEAGDARMPPMMLLPLIDHAIAHGREPAQEKCTLRVDTAVSDGRLRVTIADSGAAFAPETGGDGIMSIRERLVALYGDNAKLDSRRLDDRASEATMEIPFSRVEADDPGYDTTAR